MRRKFVAFMTAIGLGIGLAGCDTAGCPASTDAPTGEELVLEFSVDFDDAYEHRLAAFGDRIVRQLDDDDIEATSNIAHGGERPRLELDIDAAANVDDVHALIDDDFPQVVVSDRPESQLFILEFADGARDTLRPQMMQSVITSVHTSLNTDGIHGSRIRPGESDSILVDISDVDGDVDIDAIQRAADRRDRLRIRRVAPDRGESFFEEVANDAPDRSELLDAIGGIRSMTHPDHRELRSFFDDRIPDGYAVAYRFRPAPDGPAHEPAIEESDLLDEEMFDDERQQEDLWESYLLEEESPIRGHHVLDARVEIDDTFNHPYLSLTFDDEGTDLLAELTTDNIGETFAIVVGDEIHSAPVIQEPVTGGAIRMTLGQMKSFTEIQDEASNLARLFRSQSIPAQLEFVGPIDE